MKPTLAAIGLLVASWAAFPQSQSARTLTPPNLPAGFVGAPYSQTLLYSGGQVFSGWQLTSGTLPAGLAFSTDGSFSGTPTTSGISTFVVTLTFPSLSLSFSQAFSLTIVAGPPHLVITPSTLAAGSVGLNYPQNLAVSGGTGPYIWTIESGALPNGLASLYYYANLSGTPSSGVATFNGSVSASAVTSTFTVRVTDATSTSLSQTFTLPITLAISPANSSLPSGMVGAQYSQTFTAAGGAGAPYTWSSTSALPPGLILSTAGVLSGTPAGYGTWILSITVADAAATTSSQTFTLTVNPAPLVFSTASALSAGTAGTPYSQTLAATGGVPPYQWQVTSGSLPPLLSLSSAGVISGVPASPGNYSFTVTVTDSASQTATRTYSLTITLGALAVSSAATLPSGVVGVAYSQTLAASGGVPPYTWQVKSGSWPAGLSLSSGGMLSGTPTQVGSFSFTIQVTDSSGATAARAFTLSVTGAGCASSLGLSGQAFGAAGGSGSVSVTAPSGCQWTASSQLSWVAISGGASGTGNGTVSFLVAANTGAVRSGSIAIAGFPFTVEQTAASTAGLSAIGSLPHVTSGGYWEDTITLINTGAASEETLVSFYDDNGNPLSLPVNFPQAPLAEPLMASSIDRTLLPGAELLIQTVGPDAQPVVAGWALVRASGSLTGYSVFRWGEPPNQQEATAQLENRTPNAFVLSFDQTGGYVLGVAVANPASAAANVLAALYDDGGLLLSATTIALPALGHTAFMLSDQFPAAAQKRGTLVLTIPTGGQISTLAFRANTAGSLASVLPLVK